MIGLFLMFLVGGKDEVCRIGGLVFMISGEILEIK